MARESFLHDLWRSVALSLLSLVITLLIIVGVVWLLVGRGPDIEDGSWLVLDLYGPVTEYAPPGDPFSQVMSGDPLTLQDMIDNLAKAAVDDRIAGVILKVSWSHDADTGKLQELRRAVDKVQAAGKPVHAWGDTFDPAVLFLASGCDDIAMPAGGFLMWTGVAEGSFHVRGLLDKLGIVPHLSKIKDYKSAAEVIMETEMTPAAREQRTWLVEDMWDMMVPVIASERGLTEQRLVELMEYAEFMPVEAAEAGLIDEVLYWQDLLDKLRGDGDEDPPLVAHCDYAEVALEDVLDQSDETVAVVHAQGNIGGRVNRHDPMWGMMMGHESICRELRRCRLDDEVKAVVFRVDSGGGESLASDLIAHEVELLAAAKPVVVSMVDVAASGGYSISYKATKMMANPLSVTGSIGSINGIFNMRGFYDKIGFSKDFVTKGPNALLGNDWRDPTPAEWERHVDAHWKSYDDWLQDVANRRGMSFEEAELLGHGRVWTGRQAADNGLIDALGNYDDAVALAAELAEIDSEKPPKIVHLPEVKGLLGSLFGGESGVDDPVAAAMRSAVYRGVASEMRGSLDFMERGAVNVAR